MDAMPETLVSDSFAPFLSPPQREGRPRKLPTGRCGPVVLLLAALLSIPVSESGAAPKAHPDLSSRLSSIRTVGLVPPEIRIFEFSAGGMLEQRDDWSSAGKMNVIRGVASAFDARRIAVTPLTIEENRKEEIEDIQALYRAVVVSILIHSDGPNAFPKERQRFDYTLGPLEPLLDAYGVDALLFVYGRDEISTGGRKTLAVLGMAAGVVFRPGISILGIGLVDRSGKVLWYNSDYSAGHVDFRDPESVMKFSSGILSDFPEAKP